MFWLIENMVSKKFINKLFFSIFISFYCCIFDVLYTPQIPCRYSLETLWGLVLYPLGLVTLACGLSQDGEKVKGGAEKIYRDLDFLWDLDDWLAFLIFANRNNTWQRCIYSIIRDRYETVHTGCGFLVLMVEYQSNQRILCTTTTI